LAPLLAISIVAIVLIALRVSKDAAMSLLLAAVVVTVALSMILMPEPSFRAAERGLKVWWEIVLPALLPFFIAAELLMGMGVVHFMGVLMEPLMRPLFNVPGTGSFVFAMGLASGYPLGAALSARLNQDGLATKTEAERLMCFCNTSDPLFMTGAVAVGMLKRVDVGIYIIMAHYLSTLTVGVLMRFWKRDSPKSHPIPSDGRSFIVMRAYRAMRLAQKKEPKPFGEILGNAVNKSINTLLVILGFIVLSSVVFEILKAAGMAAALSSMLSTLVPERLVPATLHESIVSGIFEITIGTSMVGATQAPLITKAAIVSAIIAWSGLSVHAQVAAVIQPARMSIWPYIGTRFVQAILAGLYTVLLMKPGGARWSLPTFEPIIMRGSLAWFENLGRAATTCTGIIGAMAIICLMMAAASSLLKKN
jgi:sporulation integral membrane protein YlbJ